MQFRRWTLSHTWIQKGLVFDTSLLCNYYQQSTKIIVQCSSWNRSTSRIFYTWSTLCCTIMYHPFIKHFCLFETVQVLHHQHILNINSVKLVIDMHYSTSDERYLEGLLFKFMIVLQSININYYSCKRFTVIHINTNEVYLRHRPYKMLSRFC